MMKIKIIKLIMLIIILLANNVYAINISLYKEILPVKNIDLIYVVNEYPAELEKFSDEYFQTDIFLRSEDNKLYDDLKKINNLGMSISGNIFIFKWLQGYISYDYSKNLNESIDVSKKYIDMKGDEGENNFLLALNLRLMKNIYIGYSGSINEISLFYNSRTNYINNSLSRQYTEMDLEYNNSYNIAEIKVNKISLFDIWFKYKYENIITEYNSERLYFEMGEFSHLLDRYLISTNNYDNKIRRNEYEVGVNLNTLVSWLKKTAIYFNYREEDREQESGFDLLNKTVKPEISDKKRYLLGNEFAVDVNNHTHLTFYIKTILNRGSEEKIKTGIWYKWEMAKRVIEKYNRFFSIDIKDVGINSYVQYNSKRSMNEFILMMDGYLVVNKNINISTGFSKKIAIYDDDSINRREKFYVAISFLYK